jgi:hypothetical protein
MEGSTGKSGLLASTLRDERAPAALLLRQQCVSPYALALCDVVGCFSPVIAVAFGV